MKQKVKYGALIASAVFFLFLAILNFIKVGTFFKDPEKFTFAPMIFGVVFLFVLLGHIGLYVMMMDRKERKHLIMDESEWWKKWDMV
jgi:hypothetical protein